MFRGWMKNPYQATQAVDEKLGGEGRSLWAVRPDLGLHIPLSILHSSAPQNPAAALAFPRPDAALENVKPQRTVYVL